ncbi:hypothetical protein BDV96DRAFT_639215 [Lophiotrema nucula]|uniref:NACHT domain-containing protein n=1 Tax=Lophiotrema nucula TaxID=690887 RepID=A0A6A5ZSK3_9PLEO|nr:hypothetical protein BDV96DRAFT_639215 [Lophiotrema nucula]
MDPFSALAVATSIVQFLDFAGNILKGSAEIAKVFTKASNGKTVEHTDLHKATERLSELSKNLELRDRGDLHAYTSDHEQVIIALAQDSERVAQQLISVLHKVRVKDEATRWATCLQALKAVWKDEEIKSLKTRLDGFRSQLTLHLLAVIRNEAFSSHTDLKKQIADLQEFTAQSFLKQVNNSDKWRKSIANGIRLQYTTNDELVDDSFVPSQLAKAGLEQKSRLFADMILSTLNFEGMDDRHDTIVDAHQETYRWIFSNDESHGSWMNFPTWLQSPLGVYWITGKPGAGKSTLMKFLYGDSRTLDIVSSSSLLKVVTAAFFFWNSGKSMQMSQEGLVRSLLYQTLSKCKEYAPIAFPDRWEMYALLGQLPTKSLTWNQIRQGFYRLLEKAGSHNRLFYIIDGLDEYDGNHTDLITFLNRISKLPNVKMCVSSRPWVVFEEAFQLSPSLHVHELTYPDIKRYVTSNFHENRGYKELELEEPDYAAQLVEQIAQKSAGVFLWVAVVVKSLLNGVTNGDRIPDLQKRVDALPPDLEELFHNILHSLEPAYKQQAFQLFRVFRASKRPITIIDMTFADECDATKVLEQAVEPLPESQIQAKLGRMRRRLVSRCKCLLEVVGRDQLRAEANVQYLHRTVKDFMEKDSIWNEIVVNTSAHWDPYLQLCLSDLMQLKTIDNGSPIQVHSLFRWCIQYTADSSITDTSTRILLLDELNHATHLLAARDISVRVSFLRTLSDGALKRYWEQLDNPDSTPFINMMIQCRLTFYVKAKLDEGYPIRKNEPLAPLLFGRAYGEVDPGEDQHGVFVSDKNLDFNLLKLLLDHGADPHFKCGGYTWLQVSQISYADDFNKMGTMVKRYPVGGIHKSSKEGKKSFRMSLKGLFR